MEEHIHKAWGVFNQEGLYDYNSPHRKNVYHQRYHIFSQICYKYH
jgi:hypothetical protein